MARQRRRRNKDTGLVALLLDSPWYVSVLFGIAKCGQKMKAVAGREGRPDFWGCASYPRCRQTLGMRRDDAATAVSAT